LNLTPEAFIEILGALPQFISVYLLHKQYREHHDRALLYFQISWASFGLIFFFNGISFILLSESLFRIKNIFLFFLLVFLELAINIVTYDRISPFRLSGAIFLGGITFLSGWLEDAVVQFSYPNGYKSLKIEGIHRIFFILAVAYVVTSYGTFTIRAYSQAPDHLNKTVRLNLVGFILLGPMALLTYALKLNFILPSAYSFVIGPGVLISSYALYKNPQVLYMLPFKAYKLSIIESGSGLTLYTYNFNKREELQMIDPLFASAMESIRTMFTEALNRGRIKKIVLQTATIILQDIPFTDSYCVIIADQSTYSLNRGLEVFVVKLLENFPEITVQSLIKENHLFMGINELIPEAFPYIPKSPHKLD
jgi:hypothetical protein